MRIVIICKITLKGEIIIEVESELTHVLEGHTRDVLCLDVQKEAAFSGKDGFGTDEIM